MVLPASPDKTVGPLSVDNWLPTTKLKSTVPDPIGISVDGKVKDGKPETDVT